MWGVTQTEMGDRGDIGGAVMIRIDHMEYYSWHMDKDPRDGQECRVGLVLGGSGRQLKKAIWPSGSCRTGGKRRNPSTHPGF